MGFFGSRNSVLVFTVITALIHLALGLSYMSAPDFLGELFVLNGIGYLALMYAYLWTPSFLSGQKSLVRWAYLGFTAITIILYFVMSDSITNPVGLLTKLDEALLIFSLWQHSS